MPKLVAIKEVRYAGKTQNIGDEFDASDKDAVVLKAIKKAADVAPKNAVDLPEEVMGRAAKREPITEVEEAPVVIEKVLKPEVDEDEAPKPKRAYHRRDMVAEAPKAKPPEPAWKPPLGRIGRLKKLR